MPAGCDSVIPQEFVAEESDTAIVIAAGVLKAGRQPALCRRRPEGGQRGTRGRKAIRPADLGLSPRSDRRSAGAAPPARRLLLDRRRAASIGQPLDEGSVYDSNRYTIYGMLQRLGCDIIDMGIVRDDPAALEEALRSACENADAIITSGGVSVGAADTSSSSWRASAKSPSGRSACARGARWPSAASPRTATALSCSACPAIRWR